MISRSHPREKLSEFVDETLAPAEREAVSAHLNSCAECAQIARELGNLRATLRGIPPATAPASLRHNVRAALQNPVKSSASKPVFAWRPAQFVWTAPLALSALALMILARPDSQSPLDQPLTSASAPGQNQEASSQAPAPVRKPTSSQNQTVTTRTTPSQAVNPQKMKPSVSGSNSAKTSAAPPPLEMENAAPKGTDSRPDTLTQIQPAPSRLAPTRRSREGKNESPNRDESTTVEDRAQTPSATVLSRKGNVRQSQNPVLRRSAPAPVFPAQPRFQPSPSAVNEAPGDSDGAVATRDAAKPQRRDAPRQTSPQTATVNRNQIRNDAAPNLDRAAAPQFTFVLKAVPSASIPATPGLRDEELETREAPSAFAPPGSDLQSSVAGSTTEKENAVAKRGGVRARNGAVNPVPRPDAARAGASDAFRAPNDGIVGRLNAPATATVKAQPAIPAGTRARRFQLQIEAPRDVKGAQVRLELPPSLQLLWPVSKVVWRGDFAAGKPVTIEFSLSKARSEERIAVILEQKAATAPSIPLQTQMLMVPASSD